MSEERKNSALGLISMLTTFAAWAVFGTLLLIAVYFEITQPGGLDSMDDRSPVLMVVGLVFIIAMLFTLAGFIVGIVSLFDRSQRKLFGILGIVAGLSFFVLGAIVIILGATTG